MRQRGQTRCRGSAGERPALLPRSTGRRWTWPTRCRAEPHRAQHPATGRPAAKYAGTPPAAHHRSRRKTSQRVALRAIHPMRTAGHRRRRWRALPSRGDHQRQGQQRRRPCQRQWRQRTIASASRSLLISRSLHRPLRCESGVFRSGQRQAALESDRLPRCVALDGRSAIRWCPSRATPPFAGGGESADAAGTR